jgi:hypothetical protein
VFLLAVKGSTAVPLTMRLYVTLAFVACGFILLFCSTEKSAGTGLILAAAASLGIGSPPSDLRRRPARAGRQSPEGTATG